MEILVLGMMKNPQQAREVSYALADAGFEREDIAGDDGFIAGLCHGGVPQAEAHAYAEGVRRGGAVVAVKAGDEVGANQAAVIMSRHGALDIDKCAAGWKRQGWSGRFNAEAAIELETYVLVFGEYPAGSARIYRNRRLTRRAA
jgi:hypothetical protein